jgi:hypothetical protein
VETTDDSIPLIVFSSVGRNDEPGIYHRQLLLTEKHLRRSHCAGEVLHRCFSGCYVFDGEYIRHPPCTYSSVATVSDDDHKRCYSAVAAHISLILMRRSSRITASSLSLVPVSLHWLVGACCQCPTELTSMES